MKKVLIIFILSLSCTIVQSQTNLVGNPSFEDTISIHNPNFAFGTLIQEYIPDWYGRNCYFSEYFPSSNVPIGINNYSLGLPSNRLGYQFAHNGIAYAGIDTYVLYPNPLRSYIQNRLKQTLENGKKYKVEFYVSLADSLHTANNSIGAYFSADSFNVVSYALINQVPQIQNQLNNDLSGKTEWILVTGTFVANGTEKWMTIGNFLTDSLSDTLYLGGSCYSSNNFILCSSFYYIDDVSVTLIDETGIEEQRQSDFSLFPNPNTGIFKLQYKGIITKPLILSITDVCGKLTDKVEIKNQTTNYENTSLMNGLYFYSLRNGDEEVGRGKIMVVK